MGICIIRLYFISNLRSDIGEEAIKFINNFSFVCNS